MKKLSAIALIGVFALGLTGCSSGTEKEWELKTMTLKDGRTVKCIENQYTGSNSYASDCDGSTLSEFKK